MDQYLELDRRFMLRTKYAALDQFESYGREKRSSWDDVLQGRFSIIVGRANFGKTMELKAKSGKLREAGAASIYVALHKVLGDDSLDDALDAEDATALSAWQTEGGELIVFVDSLDEASLGTNDGIRRALRRLKKALGWPNASITWVLSSRPAVLTESILQLLQSELQTALYFPPRNSTEGEDEFDFSDDSLSYESDFFGGEQSPPISNGSNDGEESLGDVESADADSKTKDKPKQKASLKLYTMLPLDNVGASIYLQRHCDDPHPKETLNAAGQYGLQRLAEGPGGLDILAYLDPVRSTPQCLTHVYSKVVEAVQQQQRTDPREQQVGGPPPDSLDEAIGRLAGASVICQLPNIEISPKALRYREGVLSARPIIASILSEPSLSYLLGSRLFIDSGHHQVKLYPDELLPFLAAKRLASLVKSPEHARRLLASITWRATTGECGVHRVLLPLAGWLGTFNVHCRQELLAVEPQAIAFFGDLRHPQVQLHEAATALERSIERLVSNGDSLGRSHYRLTAENFWQAAKPGMEQTLLRLFERHGDDWRAREALLDIASYARLDVFRDTILAAHGHSYMKLLNEEQDLNYILSLGESADLLALSTALKERPKLSEQRVAGVLAKLAWRALDAKSIAEIVDWQAGLGRGGYSIDWTLNYKVAQEAKDLELYQLTRAILLRLVNRKKSKGRDAESYWSDQKFVEIVMDLTAQVIQRKVVSSLRAAKLCLVLNRHITKHNHGTVDKTNLRAALENSKEVRLSFLRGLVHPTDRSADGIYRAVFWFQSIYQHVDGDDADLGEPGFTELVDRWKAAAANPPSSSDLSRDREHIVNDQSKATLLGMLDRLRNASQENALAWVAHWLVRSSGQSRYSECNFELFERAVGPEIASAVREGLSVLWRTKDPTWNEEESNSTYNITIAGLHGLHLDLGDGLQLPSLTELQVRRAIRYSVFDINGYPQWLWRLVAAHEQVAAQELTSILANHSRGRVSFDKAETFIRNLNEAPLGVQRSLVPALWDFAIKNPQVSEYTIEAVLTVAIGAIEVVSQGSFEAEAWRSIEAAFEEDIPTLDDRVSELTAEEHQERQKLEQKVQAMRLQRASAVVWGSFWLWSYPGTFSKAWEGWRKSNPERAERFMFALAVHLGDSRNTRLKDVSEKGNDGLEVLTMLYEWVYSVVREEDDIRHDDGRVYSPGDRDHAQQLRDALVPAIVHAKSEKAYEVLDQLRLRATGSRAKYLRYKQFMMREEQNATKPIAQTHYLEFERTFAPQASTYIEFAMAVETDLLSVKSQIETGDFSLRRFFNSLSFDRIKTDNDGLALEEDFQSLLGNELNHAAAGRYTVTLEPILTEGTRRDVMCQMDSLRATIELKMSFRWTLEDYVVALERQLLGQYMKAPNSKIGFFVVVLQKKRTWIGPDSKPIDFGALLTILKEKAREKEIADSSVYLRVIGIDATPRVDFRTTQKEIRAAGAAASAKFADGKGNYWGGVGRRPAWLKKELDSGKDIEDFRISSARE